jgi:hypothetical protein
MNNNIEFMIHITLKQCGFKIISKKVTKLATYYDFKRGGINLTYFSTRKILSFVFYKGHLTLGVWVVRREYLNMNVDEVLYASLTSKKISQEEVFINYHRLCRMIRNIK